MRAKGVKIAPEEPRVAFLASHRVDIPASGRKTTRRRSSLIHRRRPRYVAQLPAQVD